KGGAVKMAEPVSSSSLMKELKTPRKAAWPELFIAKNSAQPETLTSDPMSSWSPSDTSTVSAPPDARLTSCIGVQPAKVPGKNPIGVQVTVPSGVLMLEFVDQCGSDLPVVPP